MALAQDQTPTPVNTQLKPQTQVGATGPTISSPTQPSAIAGAQSPAPTPPPLTPSISPPPATAPAPTPAAGAAATPAATPAPAAAAPIFTPPPAAAAVTGGGSTSGAATQPPAATPPMGAPNGQPILPMNAPGGPQSPVITPPAGPAGPNANVPLSNIGDVASNWLANPDPFKQTDVQNSYNFLSGRLGEQAQIASSQADADAAGRGLSFSTIPQMEKYGVGGIQENLGLGLGQLASNLLIPEAQMTQSGLAGALGAGTNIGAQAMAGQNQNFMQAFEAANLAGVGMPTMTGMFGGALQPMEPLIGNQGNYNPNMYAALGQSLAGTSAPATGYAV